MPDRALAITVHLHDRRYHGVPEWPPAPARLFQALVAGAGPCGLSNENRAALTWLETLAPPTIVAPGAVRGQTYTTFVPNNDLDAVQRDPNRVAEIRAAKRIAPRLLESPTFVYVWRFATTDGAEQHCRTICSVAGSLYQFGRGIDMAWAYAQDLSLEDADAVVDASSGRVYRPSAAPGDELDCPGSGSLASLETRHRATAARFRNDRGAAGSRELFQQPPRPEFDSVSYSAQSVARVYELRRSDGGGFAAWPLTRASVLVVSLRDRAAEHLKGSLVDATAKVECALVGRKADGSDDGPVAARIRIVPLPSIGHEHADMAIRRVLVLVPPQCPLRPDDVFWAFSAADVTDHATGEVFALLTPAPLSAVLDHFTQPARVWRSVTAVALPDVARRRRIDPARAVAEAKGGRERAEEEARARSAVVQALRHAGVGATPDDVRVQREPFDRNGERAEAFALTPRFPKERLWHVRIEFGNAVTGLLTLGDGRFLGLGVLAPFSHDAGVFALRIEAGLAANSNPDVLTRALRSALIARVQRELGADAPLSSFVTGHERDRSPARSAHVAFAFDADRRRLLILAPHVLEHRSATNDEKRDWRMIAEAISGFRRLRAGTAGLLALQPTAVDAKSDRLFAASRTWISATPYTVIRHAKGTRADRVLVTDIERECERLQLPKPHVTIQQFRGVKNIGLIGRATVTFDREVPGPIILGRKRYFGGGLFVAAARAEPAPIVAGGGLDL